MANPIWKDYFVTLGTADAIIYRIKVESTSAVIYTGKAYKRPGDTNNQIRINDICADYISNLPVSSAAPSFRVQKYTNGTWTNVNSTPITFVFDWSYDNVSQRSVLSAPVIKRVASTQPILYCCNYSTIDIDYVYEDGSEDSDQIIGTASPYGGYIYRIVPDDLDEGISRITLDRNIEYEVVRNCNAFALIYRNAFGGYDSLLLEGNHMETDNLERHNIKVDESNAVASHRHTRNIANEITKKYTLHTGWLTDVQSSKMHHLLNSTDVVLFDLVDAKETPVILTNVSTEYKTYKNNGNSLVNYDIEVEVAQDRIRR